MIGQPHTCQDGEINELLIQRREPTGRAPVGRESIRRRVPSRSDAEVAALRAGGGHRVGRLALVDREEILHEPVDLLRALAVVGVEEARGERGVVSPEAVAERLSSVSAPPAGGRRAGGGAGERGRL